MNNVSQQRHGIGLDPALNGSSFLTQSMEHPLRPEY